MTVIDFRIEPQGNIPDNEIVERIKEVIEKEFGELFEFSVLNID